MPVTADFLVEIGTEELPPKALRDLETAFAEGVTRRLAAAGLGGNEARSFATPRRLAVLVRGVALAQAAQRVERRGPPVKVAFDTADKPTRAAQAFAESCGVAVASLEKLETAAGAWLVFRGESPGRRAADVLPGIVAETLAELPVPRRMRWGSSDIEFVRPVHWLVMMLGPDVVPAVILGLASGNRTRGHRFMSGGPIELKTPADYEAALTGTGCVLPDFLERNERIREIATAAGQAVGGETVLEEAVLDEVTALVEWPVAVTGRFDQAYLRLPEEVLIATLQGHQRYFPLRGRDGRLLPNFIAMSNLRSLRTRPGAARQRTRRQTPLGRRGFFLGTGSAQTTGRPGGGTGRRRVPAWPRQSARPLGADRGNQQATGSAASRAGRTRRTRGTPRQSRSVDECRERVPGAAGPHGLSLRPAKRRAGSSRNRDRGAIPAADTRATASHRHALGQCLALADRLDTLAGIFALGKRPSGNKDPFGLRRSALGMVRTLIEARIDLSLPEQLAAAVAVQPVKIQDPAALVSELYDFVIDRLRAWYLDGQAPAFAPGEITAEMFEAVRVRAPVSPLDFHERLRALKSFMAMSEAQSLAVANKRIANILKGTTETLAAEVNPALFDAGEERRLHEAVEAILPLHRSSLATRQYGDVLRRLAALREPVDEFFTAVMVMTDDPGRRRNRLALLQQLRHLFLDVADLSCLNMS